MKYKLKGTDHLVDATQWTGNLSELETEPIHSAGYDVYELKESEELILRALPHSAKQYKHDIHILGVPKGWWIVIDEQFPATKMRPAVFAESFDESELQACPVCGDLVSKPNAKFCIYCGAPLERKI